MSRVLIVLLFATPVFAQPATPNVRDRSEPVRVALSNALGKNADAITAGDLEKVTELKLPHIHIRSFKDDDFAGLAKLKKLHFYSLLHNMGRPNDPIAISDKVFMHLPNLEELIMNEQLGRLPDNVFTGLTSLRVLDLTYSQMNRLPKSMLTLPRIETVYYEGRGMSKEDFATLKNALGDKHQMKRKK